MDYGLRIDIYTFTHLHTSLVTLSVAKGTFTHLHTSLVTLSVAKGTFTHFNSHCPTTTYNVSGLPPPSKARM
jgi:hypothetical protein